MSYLFKYIPWCLYFFLHSFVKIFYYYYETFQTYTKVETPMYLSPSSNKYQLKAYFFICLPPLPVLQLYYFEVNLRSVKEPSRRRISMDWNILITFFGKTILQVVFCNSIKRYMFFFPNSFFFSFILVKLPAIDDICLDSLLQELYNANILFFNSF